MNPPDWAFAKLLVQQYYPFPVGKLTAAEFLDAFWQKINLIRIDNAGKWDQNGENVRKKRELELIQMRT